MATGALFDRKIQITLAKPVTGSFTKMEPNAVVVTDLRMSFKIEKKLQKNPNTASVVLYNLAPQTRALIEKKPLHIRLDAGYGTVVHRLWIGDMTFSSSRYDNVDWITEIEIANGERAFNHARVNRSFRKAQGGSGANCMDVVNEVSKSMEMPVTIPDIVKAELKKAELKHAMAIRGPSRKVLDKVLKSNGLEWSMQDGQIQILRPEQIRADQAHLINQSTGLIGTPEYNAPKKPGEKAVLKFRMLLYAGLVPGQKIKVESDTISGLFRMEAVTHTGDTHSNEFFSDVEAKPI
jgi:hypothetical protein